MNAEMISESKSEMWEAMMSRYVTPAGNVNTRLLHSELTNLLDKPHVLVKSVSDFDHPGDFVRHLLRVKAKGLTRTKKWMGHREAVSLYHTLNLKSNGCAYTRLIEWWHVHKA
jgi:hypothetical protein